MKRPLRGKGMVPVKNAATLSFASSLLHSCHFGLAGIALAALLGGCDGSDSSGSAGNGGGGGGGGGGGTGGSATLQCPASPAVEQVVSTVFPGPGGFDFVGTVNSILLSGQDLYYTTANLDGAAVYRATPTTQPTLFFQNSQYTPLSQLVSAGQSLYWYDAETQPGRVVKMPLAGGAPSVQFPNVHMGILPEIEQYFDTLYGHTIFANTQAPNGTWRNQLMRTLGAGDAPKIFFSRDNGNSGEAFRLVYAKMGDFFYVVGAPDNGSTDYKILRIAENENIVDPENPPSVAPTFNFTCMTLAARGDSVLWCLRPFEGAMDNGGDRIRVMFFLNVDTYHVQDVFSLSDAPASAGKLTGKAATDGNNLFFATDAVDGNGVVTSTIFQVSADVGIPPKILACGLPRISDMTLGNGYLYFGLVETNPDKIDKNGIHRIAY
ncbi:MAG: hypothetical protein IPK82_34165 [Polyangiaceae bacterium]|nr:hypothetical protein [Polyangiaceae bacterium]